jgi:hypothetical protein
MNTDAKVLFLLIGFLDLKLLAINNDVQLIRHAV